MISHIEKLRQLHTQYRSIQVEIRKVRDQMEAEMRDQSGVDKRIAYNKARREHAYRLREEGLTLNEVGQRLGVGREAARHLCYIYASRARNPNYYKDDE